MSDRMKKRGMVVLIACLVLIGLLTIEGCKKKEEPTTTNEAAKVVQEKASAVEIEQKICPIMGNPINKEVFTEYKGQKVYFCCAACIEKFKAEPEKYLSKLPQFKDK